MLGNHKTFKLPSIGLAIVHMQVKYDEPKIKIINDLAS